MARPKPSQTKNVYSLVQAAGILGVHRNTLAKWIDQGCPILSRADRSTGTEWEISIPDVVQWRIDTAVADAVARYGGDDGRITKDEADRRRAVAQAITAEVEADRERGSVVAIADVVDVVSKEYSQLRANLMNVGADVAGDALLLKSAPAIQKLVDNTVSKALRVLIYDSDQSSRA